MAAGLGTRMKSAVPKHLHPLLGRRMVDWALDAVRPLAPSPLVVVSSPETREELAADGVEVAVQAEPRGTGDAVAAARGALEGFEGDVLVLPGRLAARHDRAPPGGRRRAAEERGRRHPARGRDRAGARLRADRPRRHGRRPADRRGARRDARGAGDPGAERLLLRVRGGGPLVGPRPARHRQRPGRALPDGHDPPPRRGGPDGRRRDDGRRRRGARGQRPRRPRARGLRPAPAHPRGPHAGRRHDRRPGDHVGRGRRRARARHRPPPVHDASRPHPRRVAAPRSARTSSPTTPRSARGRPSGRSPTCAPGP